MLIKAIIFPLALQRKETVLWDESDPSHMMIACKCPAETGSLIWTMWILRRKRMHPQV